MSTYPSDHPVFKGLTQRELDEAETLEFSGSYLDDDDVEFLVKLLARNTSLTMLDVSNNVSLGNRGVTAIARLLDTHPILELYLHGNDVRGTGFSALAAAIRRNTTLTCLTMENNFPSTQGWCDLCDAFAINTSITQLDVDDMCCTNGLKSHATAAMIRTNHTLHSLTFGIGNIHNDTGLTSLFTSIQRSATLLTLDLWITYTIRWTDQLWMYFHNMVAWNTSLTHLRCDVHERQLDRFCTALRINQSMYVINVCIWHVSVSQIPLPTMKEMVHGMLNTNPIIMYAYVSYPRFAHDIGTNRISNTDHESLHDFEITCTSTISNKLMYRRLGQDTCCVFTLAS